MPSDSEDESGGEPGIAAEAAERGDGTVEHTSEIDMLQLVSAKTGIDVALSKNDYNPFIAHARLVVQSTQFFDRLSDLHRELSEEFLVGKIRAVDAWANGETAFKILEKPWESVVDKLYRVNIEDNDRGTSPPRVFTIEERASKAFEPGSECWVTPETVHNFADDLLRTKFVVPFVDGVMNVSRRVIAAADSSELRWYQRYHAKDSGYHAHHVYVLLPITDLAAQSTHIALEIKVLTKLQENLGELTHLLYELKRTGKVPSEKKRKLAWMLNSPDFQASYVGHSAHYIEAAMVGLKAELEKLEREEIQNGEP